MKLCEGLAIVLTALLVLGVGTTRVAAYPDWASGCNACHGDFNKGSYVSLADGQVWGTDLMSGHIDMLIGGANDCEICHTAPGKSPAFLASSDGGRGLPAISCLGCHGREEGTGVTGAGLRQHHFRNGVALCGNPFCHFDGDPASFTPVGEDIRPPYFANPGTDHPLIPDHPCNLAGFGFSEDIMGVANGGLDNDGDDRPSPPPGAGYDGLDADCSAVVPIEPSTWGRIKALYK